MKAALHKCQNTYWGGGGKWLDLHLKRSSLLPSESWKMGVGRSAQSKLSLFLPFFPQSCISYNLIEIDNRQNSLV